MKFGSSLLLIATALIPPSIAAHDQGCLPTRADPGTYNLVDLPDGSRYYGEERNTPFGHSPPLPGEGFLFGGGTWIYQETNGFNLVEGSLQRGGPPLLGYCPPGPLVCLIGDEDPILDASCGHGPDKHIF